MQVLVTGATGKVGNAIASALLERGDEVRALVRDPQRAASILPAGVEPIRGRRHRPREPGRRGRGLRARLQRDGDARAVGQDEGIFERVNAVGSQQVASPRSGPGCARFVHTSTHDVFHAETGQRFDETMLADYPKGTAYERSKQHAEELVLAERDGMEVVILNPSGVYGPDAVARPPRSRTGSSSRWSASACPAVPPGGTGLRLRRGRRRRAPARRREGEGRRALHPRRRLRELPRDGRDGEARSPAAAASRR